MKMALKVNMSITNILKFIKLKILKFLNKKCCSVHKFWVSLKNK